MRINGYSVSQAQVNFRLWSKLEGQLDGQNTRLMQSAEVHKAGSREFDWICLFNLITVRLVACIVSSLLLRVKTYDDSEGFVVLFSFVWNVQVKRAFKNI